MDDFAQNPEAQKLAQMLQQQQIMKFLQSMQGSGATTEMDRAQLQGQPNYEAMTSMAQDPMQAQRGMPIINPQGDYRMPLTEQSYSTNMPTNPPQIKRPGMLQGAMSELDRQIMMQQGIGQGAMSNLDYQMMRKR